MITYITTVSKYLFIALMLFYTWESFSALRTKNVAKQNGIYQRQNIAIFLTYLVGFIMVMINHRNINIISIIILAGAQLCYLVIMLGVFPVIYPNMNKGILSNMCMLLTIGFIVLARLDYSGSVKQFIIVAVVSLLSLFVPWLMQKEEWWKKLTWFYGIIGILALLGVLVLGKVTNGANLSLNIGGFAFQPSEFVKIIFVFFIAAMLAKDVTLKKIIISGICAAIYVVVLVLSTDLGSALIFFMIYLFMLYVATRQARWLVIGLSGLAVASVIAYNLFSHVQDRVSVWLDPWSRIENEGWQVTHSLFALANGKFLGTGLFQGKAATIPEVKKDFVFSVIGEEFGGIFGMLLILVCLACFIGFLVTAMKQLSLFNKLICVGLGIQYAVQVILTIGGAIKMIPSTGVTLPLISYGGSSILSTLIVFAIIQGLAIVGTNNEELKFMRNNFEREDDEKRRKKLEQTQELPKIKIR